MKKQILLVLTLIAFSCFANTVMAQVVTKKKTPTTVVKKSTSVVKKTIGTVPKKVTNAATTKKNTSLIVPTMVNNTVGGYKCKVTKTQSGCTIVFESAVGSTLGKDSKGSPSIRKEYKVSYRDNAVTEIGKAVVSMDAEKAVVKAKGEAAIMNEEEMVTNATSDQSHVSIKNLSFVFDVLKDKKELPITNGEATLPAHLSDGIYVMKVNWNWDMSTDKATKTYCSLTFKIQVKDGSYVDIMN